MACAAVQAIASLERWVTAAGSWTRTDASIEDHRFDYVLHIGNTTLGYLVATFTIRRTAGQPGDALVPRNADQQRNFCITG